MVALIKAKLLPELYARGFSDIPQHKEPIPMWDLNRPRVGGGYDLISVIFDKRRRPRFYAIINRVDQAGVNYHWREPVPAQNVTAATLLSRVYIRRRNKGILALLLPRWFAHTMFGFKPREDAAFNKRAAEGACSEFLTCLGQAEHWWKTGEIGPNLSEVHLVVGNGRGTAHA